VRISGPSTLLSALLLGCQPLPPAPNAIGETFAVSPDGDDGAAGTAEAPWRSLGRAAEQVGPGDTVIVQPGRYDGFVLHTSGAPQAPIRFLAEPGAVIERPRTRDGINLEGASHVELRGFTVVSAERAGIRAVECRDVVIRRNRVERNGKWGIFTGFCDDVVIEDNEALGSREQHGIYVSNSGDRPVIRGNQCTDNAAGGIQLNGDVHMGKGDGIITGALIEGNVIAGNGRRGGAALNLDGVQSSVIVNNLLHDNQATGIALFRIDGGGPSSGNLILHNTVVMPAERSRWALLLRDAATDNTIRNNILLSLQSRKGAIDASADSLPGLVSDHNLVSDRFTVDDAATIVPLGTWRRHTGGDERSLIAPAVEQIFVDARRGDYRLAEGCPARDRGTAAPTGGQQPPHPLPSTDLAGIERPQGAGPDLGAYEAPAR
jgi:parallel beta-helix repeat protein